MPMHLVGTHVVYTLIVNNGCLANFIINNLNTHLDTHLHTNNVDCISNVLDKLYLFMTTVLDLTLSELSRYSNSLMPTLYWKLYQNM